MLALMGELIFKVTVSLLSTSISSVMGTLKVWVVSPDSKMIVWPTAV